MLLSTRLCGRASPPARARAVGPGERADRARCAGDDPSDRPDRRHHRALSERLDLELALEPTDSVAVIEGDHVRRGQTSGGSRHDRSARELRRRRTQRRHPIRARTDQTQYQAQLNIGQGSEQVRNAQAAVGQAQQTLELDQTQSQPLSGAACRAGTSRNSKSTSSARRFATTNSKLDSAKASLASAALNARVNGTYQQGLQAANVASAQAAAQSAYAQAAQIQAPIDKTVIRSPVDGVVVNRNLNPGEYPGSQTIFTVQQLDPVYAELNASSTDVFRIRRGAAVAVSVAGVDGATYRGRVNAVLGQVEPGSTNFTVEAILANPGLRLKSGMAVTGTVSLPTVSGVGIPATAFLDDQHDTVMIVDANGNARQVSVREEGSDGKTSIVAGLASRNEGRLERPARPNGRSADRRHAVRLPEPVVRAMWPTRLFVLRPTLVFVTLALVAVAGAVALATIVQQQFPNIDFPTITVRASYPGGSTTEIRDAIVRPIEDAIAGRARPRSHQHDRAARSSDDLGGVLAELE